MRPLATGGGRTARTDQSDKGMCLCREAGGGGDPTDMGCTRLHPPGVGGHRAQSKLGQKPAELGVECGNAPLARAALPSAALFPVFWLPASTL